MINKPCLCNQQLYRVRSYTYDFLRAIKPFYEIICFSKMPELEIMQIIKHVENVLNKSRDYQNKVNFHHSKGVNSNMRGSKLSVKGRQQEYLQPQTFFQFILNEDKDFLHIESLNTWVPNLQLLLRNRKKYNIYMVSGDI